MMKNFANKAKKAVSILLVLIVVSSLVPAALAAEPITEKYVYDKMIALKSEYPEGMRWTNADSYAWPVNVNKPPDARPNTNYHFTGYGCVAFAMILSDAAFGRNTTVREHYDYSKLKVGDILRVDGDRHTVIVLEIGSANVTIAEGNYNSSVHWGRKITHDNLKKSLNYIWTRYDEAGTGLNPSVQPDPVPNPVPNPLPDFVINPTNPDVPIIITPNDTTAFLTRMYNLCLDRGPDPIGLASWTGRLNNGEETGTTVARGFFFSEEMNGKNLNNSDFVERLYNALLGRDSDPVGKEHWLRILDSGVSRAEVLNYFTVSDEFGEQCAKYGIKR